MELMDKQKKPIDIITTVYFLLETYLLLQVVIQNRSANNLMR